MKRRMNNFFKKDGKSFVLAMDHAAMMPSPDLKDPGHVIREAVAGGADGFLTTYGIIKAFQNDFGNAGIIMRADGGISALRKPMNPLSLLHPRGCGARRRRCHAVHGLSGLYRQ